MPISRLTQRQVDALKPEEMLREVRDSVVRGFGVRVLPSGRKWYFLHIQTDGKRAWRSIGDARAMALECARERARSLLAARRGTCETAVEDGRDILFEDVAEEVFRRYSRHWKPGTLQVNRCYYRNRILPWFKGRAIGDITRPDVQRWFASLHATPVAADRSAPVLSVILRQAEIYGYRPEGSNPCTGIKRYRRRNRERFLNDNEIRRLSHCLDQEAFKAASVDRDCSAAASHRMPEVRDPQSQVVGLSRGQTLPARQQDRPTHGLALLAPAPDP